YESKMIMSSCNEIDFVPTFIYVTLFLKGGSTMRKVVLRMNEDFKYSVIKKLVDSNGNKKRAALQLNCSIRTINRLIIKYKSQGKAGFVHKNRGRKPPTSFSDDTKRLVIDLYRTKYYDSNFTHFCELLKKHEGISVSSSTLKSWLFAEGILSPKARKKTVRKMRSILNEQKNAASSKKAVAEAIDKLEMLDRSQAHPRRPRCAYFGELIQMDASPHVWFADQTTHLHLAIDDATGKIVGAFFDKQETLNAYYHVTFQILTVYGIPARFLTDRRSVFEYKRKNTSRDEEDAFTQFSYACHQLGIDLDCSSVPQAKGRVERLNQTLQSRLPIELRLAGVTTIEEANEFLNSYIKEFNEQFSLPLNDTKTVFEKQPSVSQINKILAVLSTRKLDNGNCIRYKNKYYIPVCRSGAKAYLKKGMEALVIESFDHHLYVNILDHMFALEEVKIRKDHSDEFDTDTKPKQRKIYIPPLSHPWKHASFQAYLAKQKHRSENRC
ncbi:ISNCY family transposase, partial [Enterococcus faecium]|nr:ISNCY family transposase [Enterococcus faecium]